MPSFSSLPDELIRNSIIRAHWKVFPPDPTVLALRAACKRFHKLIPLEDMLAISRDTAEWLLDGKPVIWTEMMNTYEMDCSFSLNNISIRLQGVLLNPMNHPMSLKNGGHVYFNPVPYDGIHMMRVKSHGINCSPTIVEVKTPNVVASCTLFRNQYFLLANGTVTKTWVSSSDKRSAQRFKEMTTRHQKQITIPDRSNNDLGYPKYSKMLTSDGRVFWLKNMAGDLDVIHWQGPNEMIQVAASVKDFQLINNAAVFLTAEGNLRIVHLKIKDNTVAHFTSRIFITSVSHFHIFPSLKSLWTVSSYQHLIRHGKPFIITTNDTVLGESTSFSANALHAKLAQMRKKLKTRKSKK
jgi:hypothetical protein